jgi:hypothetical protein
VGRHFLQGGTLPRRVFTIASATTRRRVLAAALAAAVAGLAVLGGRSLTARRNEGKGQAGAALSAAVSAAIPGLEAFVESARGLTFLSPVKVSVLDDAAFRRKYDQGGATDNGPPDVGAGVLRALGVPEADGQSRPGADQEPDAVDGFYDTDTKELVVRGVRPTPFVRQVLVHELTHALDDQHFGLDPEVPDDEAALADDALVEGDATAVEYRYVDSLSPEEQRAAADEEGSGPGGGGSDVADPLADLADFPYDAGPDFVSALVAAGGQARVDEAFRAPPTTSAEVLHPDRYLSGRSRAPVPEVGADGTVVDQGVVGEYLLGLVLGETLPVRDAERAAAGWAGDHYVAWRAGPRTCVRTTVVVDSATDADELASALRTWAADHRGTTVDASSAVTFSRCA